jgi:hypothetical protein
MGTTPSGSATHQSFGDFKREQKQESRRSPYFNGFGGPVQAFPA